ncbi:MAG: DNA-binding response regulator [Thermoflexia bacterium]|nr:MAG: DNA-binding response regulator [Thermoflexia bacterium]
MGEMVGPRNLVLVIDDEPDLLEMVQIILQNAGFEVITAIDGFSGLRMAYQKHPDQILLDMMIPDMDGLEVCRRLRELTDVPIIFLTARSSIEDIVAAFSNGADDYLTKPFHAAELISRIWSMLRRAMAQTGKESPVIVLSSAILLDCDRHELEVEGRRVYLTPTEFKVLRYLMQHAGRTLTADAILAHVWGPEYIGEPDLVKQYIYRLRQKIEPDPDNPRYIHTIRGGGYYFEE